MLKKILLTTIILIILGAGIYYFFFYDSSPVTLTENESDNPNLTFNPINRPGTAPKAALVATTSKPIQEDVQALKIPTLRQISTSPIGGFMASTTASSTIVRYIDRGVGHIYEALSDDSRVRKISNTTIPKIYESYWNRDLSSAVLRYIKSDAGSIISFYAEIRPIKTSTSTTGEIKNEIKGKFLSTSIRELAVSPKRDRIFTLNQEDGKGIGYVSGFDESKKTKIFETPMLQINAEWPEENTITLTTKASGLSSGYLYFYDVKKGTMKGLLGRITALSTKTSSDAKKILFSSNPSKPKLSLFNTADNSTQEVVFRTLADKCVWSRLHTSDIYCAVPTEIPAGLYPDDWYKGNVSFVDQIWYLDSSTGEVRLLANLLNLSNDLIDAANLSLDPKENFLYFINKRDLTLWSLDLTN